MDYLPIHDPEESQPLTSATSRSKSRQAKFLLLALVGLLTFLVFRVAFSEENVALEAGVGVSFEEGDDPELEAAVDALAEDLDAKGSPILECIADAGITSDGINQEIELILETMDSVDKATFAAVAEEVLSEYRDVMSNCVSENKVPFEEFESTIEKTTQLHNVAHGYLEEDSGLELPDFNRRRLLEDGECDWSGCGPYSWGQAYQITFTFQAYATLFMAKGEFGFLFFWKPWDYEFGDMAEFRFIATYGYGSYSDVGVSAGIGLDFFRSPCDAPGSVINIGIGGDVIIGLEVSFGFADSEPTGLSYFGFGGDVSSPGSKVNFEVGKDTETVVPDYLPRCGEELSEFIDDLPSETPELPTETPELPSDMPCLTSACDEYVSSG